MVQKKNIDTSMLTRDTTSNQYLYDKEQACKHISSRLKGKRTLQSVFLQVFKREFI